MTKFFKLNFGMVLAIVYLLMIFYAIIEGIASPPEPMSGLGVLILTAPWSFIFLVVFENYGIITTENSAVSNILITFGGLINASILYLLGSLLTKIFSFFRRKEKKLS